MLQLYVFSHNVKSSQLVWHETDISSSKARLSPRRRRGARGCCAAAALAAPAAAAEGGLSRTEEEDTRDAPSPQCHKTRNMAVVDRVSRLLNEMRRQSAAGNLGALPSIFSRMVENSHRPLPLKASSLMLEACDKSGDAACKEAVAELCRRYTAEGDKASLERILSGQGAESTGHRIKTSHLGASEH